MAFFKTLTLFIVCISIFRIIISKTKIVRKRRNQEYQKNCLFGYLNCNGCGTDEVLIIILENGDYSTTSTATCDNYFYVYSNTTELGEQKNFTGDFHDTCVPGWKNVTNVTATFVDINTNGIFSETIVAEKSFLYKITSVTFYKSDNLLDVVEKWAMMNVLCHDMKMNERGKKTYILIGAFTNIPIEYFCKNRSTVCLFIS